MRYFPNSRSTIRGTWTKTDSDYLGEIDHFFEIAEDFAEVFQSAARVSDHYGPLPQIDEEICLRHCDRRRLSQITECRFKEIGDPLPVWRQPGR
jgi:hypothetical protein